MTSSSAALEIAALDKSEFDSALEAIIHKDAETLGVERVSYWMLRSDPPSIQCELGFVQNLHAYERGAILEEQQCPSYFDALRTEEMLAADDALSDARTRELTESYLRPLGITSMLDVPVWSRGALVGVLCHEHVGPRRRWNHVERAFALTVAQAVATCLEARECRRAERAAERAEFLARATGVLTESLDVESIPARLVDLSVPELADWCVLDVVRDGERLDRVAVAHVDPRRRLDLLELARRYPPSVRSEHPSARAFAGGQALLVPELTDPILKQYCVDDAHCAALRALGTRSVMAVPLAARGARLGAIVFAADSRRYTHDDLQLAEALATRAAIAIDNARLHRAAEEAIARRDEFLAMAAHELYTPLTALVLAASHLDQVVPESARRSVAMVQRGARRLTRLVDEMLDVSRTASGTLKVQRQRGDLVEVARRAVDASTDAARRAGCALTLRAPARVPGAWDAARVEQLVTSVIHNAIKFGIGRPIDVEVSADGTVARVAVRDRGPGIAPEDVERIFDRFERAERPGAGGLGLGLFLARGIAEAHGGSLTASSTPGRGATFVIELPLGKE